MDILLDDEGIVRAMGEHRAKAFRALFVDPQGPNWRNNVAHGALATDASPGVPATLSLLGILAVCAFVARAQVGLVSADQ